MESIASNVSESQAVLARRALGKLASIVSAPQAGRPESAGARRFGLQSGAGSLVPDQRVKHCLRTPTGHQVQLQYHPATGSASYVGLQTCGSVWMCPCCAAKISERRRDELGRGIAAWTAEAGRRVIMVTFTVRHKAGVALDHTLEGLLTARRKMLQGRRAVAFAGRHGIAGRVKALEVTHGANGWHPHLHEIWFLEAGVDLPGLVRELEALWGAMVEASGLGKVNKHGCRVQLAEWTAAEYVAKFGRDREIEPEWHLEHELTKSNSKEGRGSGSRSPMALLAAYTWDGDEEAGGLWKEYARTLKGRNQLTWSRGLRDLLGLGEEQSDAEIAEEQQDTANFVLSLTVEEWRAVVGQDARAELLDIAAKSGGSATAVAEWLYSLGVWRYGPPC